MVFSKNKNDFRNYYILQHDWNFDFLKNKKSFSPYTGEPINFGVKLNFPKIKLNFNSENIPDCIPNVEGYMVFNQNIITILKNAGIDYIQYFDVDVMNNEGNIITDDYKCLNFLKVIDAIDLENSKLTWSEVDGEETEEDRFIMDVLDLKLKYQNIGNELLFRLKGCENLLLFREDIAQAIVNKKCTGLEFYPAEGYSF